MGGKISRTARQMLGRGGRPRTVSTDIGSASEFDEISHRPTPEMQRAAWDRNSTPRSITAWVCGDPPPGHSALDKRNGVAARTNEARICAL